MKAVYINSDHLLEIREMAQPKIQNPMDIKIKITSASLCACDHEIAEGKHPFAGADMVLGHEFGGIVEEVGTKVSDIRPGDKVCVDPLTSCGVCHSCLSKRPNICTDLKTMGVHINGGFTEYIVVDRRQVHPYGNQAISEKILSLAEPYSVGAQTNLRADTQLGDKVVVIGAGAIGLCAMQVAKMRGADVLVADLVDNRLKRAEEMGADAAVNTGKKDFMAQVMEFTDGLGADVIINTACAGGTMESAIEAAAYGARIVTVGLNQIPCTFAQADLTKKEITICGSRLSTRLFPYVVKGIDRGFLTPEKLVTHWIKLENIREGFELSKNHPDNVCKVMIDFGD